MKCSILLAIGLMFAGVSLAGTPPHAVYSTAGYHYGRHKNNDGANDTIVTMDRVLAFPGATLEEMADCTFYGWMVGKSISSFGMAQNYFNHVYRDPAGNVKFVVAALAKSDSNFTKCVVVKLTSGPGGVYAQGIGSRFRNGSGQTTTSDFVSISPYGEITFNYTEGLFALNNNVDGYGIRGLHAAKMSIPEPQRLFANNPGEKPLTLDDLKDMNLSGRLVGGSVNFDSSAQYVDVPARNLMWYYDNETGSATNLIFELKLIDEPFLKCQILQLTNGVDGIYYHSVTSCCQASSKGVDYRFLNADGTYNEIQWWGTVSHTPFEAGYGVCGLKATWTGTVEPPAQTGRTYSNPFYAYGYYDSTARTSTRFMTAQRHLAFPGATLEELEGAQLFGWFSGRSVSSPAGAQSYAMHGWRDAGGKLRFLIAGVQKHDDPFVKCVVVKLTEGPEGVWAECPGTRFLKAAASAVSTTDFVNVDSVTGEVTYNFNEGLLATNSQSDGYALSSVHVAKVVATTAPALAFANAPDEPVLTVDDLKDYVFSGSLVGSAIGAQGCFAPAVFCNQRAGVDAATGLVTNILVEAQYKDNVAFNGSSTLLKGVVLNLTDGQDGVYAQIVRTGYTNTTVSVGYRFLNDDGSLNGLDARMPAVASLFADGYGLAGLKAAPANAVDTARWTGLAGGETEAPANWACENLGRGGLAGRIPGPDSTLVLAGGLANFNPASVAASPHRDLAVRDIQLPGNLDFRPFGRVIVPLLSTVDLWGRTLDLALLSGFGSIVDSVGGGTLDLDIAEGVTNVNESVVFAGTFNIVKKGAGTFVAADTASTRSGHVTVEEGTLQLDTASALGTLDTLMVAEGSTLVLTANINVANLVVNGACEGTGCATVTGTYRPASETLPAVMLSGDAVTLDLSTRSRALNAAAGGGLAFASSVTVNISLGSRNPHAGDQLIAWTEMPTSTTFTTDNERVQKYGLLITERGLFVRGGLCIFIR